MLVGIQPLRESSFEMDASIQREIGISMVRAGRTSEAGPSTDGRKLNNSGSKRIEVIFHWNSKNS
jgi:hypothetical protein